MHRIKISWKSMAAAIGMAASVGVCRAQTQGGEIRFPSAKVSLEIRALPVDRALKAIGERVGLTLFAGRSLKDDTIIVAVNQTPVSEMCRELASVLHAKWMQTPKGLLLERTTAAIKAEDAHELDALRSYYAQALDALREKFKNLPPWNSESAQQLAKAMLALQKQEDPLHFKYDVHVAQCELEESGASGRIVQNILANLSPTELAGLPRRERVTYAVNPTAEERPLEGIGQELAGIYQQYHQIWIDAVKQVAPNWHSPGGFNYGQGNGLSDTVEASAPPARAVFGIERTGFGSNTNIEFKLFDAAGHQLSRSNFEIPEVAKQALAWAPTDPGLLDSKIALSVESRQLVEALKTHARLDAESAIGALLLRKLNPIDPLGFVTSDALLGLSQLLHKNLIALVPDTAFELAQISEDELTVMRLLSGLPKLGMSLNLDSGWIKVVPVCRSIAREDRLDRTALWTFIKKAQIERVSIDSMADYASAHGADVHGPVSEPMMHLFCEAAFGDFDKSDWRALRLYGFLSPAQRDDIKANRPVLTPSWSPELNKEVYKAVFRSWTSLEVVPGAPVDSISLSNLMDEPAEILTNGLSPSSYLIGSASTAHTITGPLVFIPGYPPEMKELTAGDIAIGIYAHENPTSRYASSRRAVIGSGSRLSVGTTDRLQLHLRLAPTYQLSGTLAARSPIHEMVSVTSLPSWINDDIQRILDAIRKKALSSGDTVKPPLQ